MYPNAVAGEYVIFKENWEEYCGQIAERLGEGFAEEASFKVKREEERGEKTVISFESCTKSGYYIVSN